MEQQPNILFQPTTQLNQLTQICHYSNLIYFVDTQSKIEKHFNPTQETGKTKESHNSCSP